MKKLMAFSVAVVVAGLIAAWCVRAADDQAVANQVTVKGEVLDIACYIDHGAHGEKHAQCAATCIESGLPVGIKGEDGKQIHTVAILRVRSVLKGALRIVRALPTAEMSKPMMTPRL